MGNLMGAAVSNVYYPAADRTASTISRGFSVTAKESSALKSSNSGRTSCATTGERKPRNWREKTVCPASLGLLHNRLHQCPTRPSPEGEPSIGILPEESIQLLPEAATGMPSPH
jgi:hypothetical protein